MPWALIGDDPSQFFNISCLPTDFKFQDPSRMGVQVKSLLSHLWLRQEVFGVKTFQFQHVLKDNEMVLAEYPPAARDALSSDPVTQEPIKSDPIIPGPINVNQGSPEAPKRKGKHKNLDNVKTPSKQKSPAKSMSATKAKSWAKAKGKYDSLSNKSLIKLKDIQDLPCTPAGEDSRDVFRGFPIALIIPTVLFTPIALFTPGAPFTPAAPAPTAAPTLSSFHFIPTPTNCLIPPQYDPLLLAGSESVRLPPLDKTNPAYNLGWMQNQPHPLMPPQLNAFLMADPRLEKMFQQFMSHLSSSISWGPVDGGSFQLAFGAPSSGAPSAAISAATSAATSAAAQSTVATNNNGYIIPPEEPPFSIFQQPMPFLQWSNDLATLDLTPLTPATKPPGKRKRADEIPYKTPTRSSNRTITPRKFIKIE